MRSKKQYEITLEVTLKDGKKEDWPNKLPRLVRMTGVVAKAFEKLLAAGEYGVHRSEFCPDVLARFEQLNVPYKCFEAPHRGTSHQLCWIKLAFEPDDVIHLRWDDIGEVAA